MEVIPINCVYRLDIRDPKEFSKDYAHYLVQIARYAATHNVEVSVEKRKNHEREFNRCFPFCTEPVLDWADAIALAKRAVKTLRELEAQEATAAIDAEIK